MNEYVHMCTYACRFAKKQNTNSFGHLFLADIHLPRKTTCDQQEFFACISCVVYNFLRLFSHFCVTKHALETRTRSSGIAAGHKVYRQEETPMLEWL